MKPATCRNLLVIVALGIGISACSRTAELGVTHVTQAGVDVAALPTALPLFPSATPEATWYERHFSSQDGCRPFLVVEDPTGTAADIYSDTRC